MRISILSIIGLFFIFSCSNVPKYYQGHIYDNNKKPLADIKICEQNIDNCIKTDSEGFFRLEKNETSIHNLIVFYDDKPIDTLVTVWSQHGERIEYSFIENKKDTLYINLEKKGMILK